MTSREREVYPVDKTIRGTPINRLGMLTDGDCIFVLRALFQFRQVGWPFSRAPTRLLVPAKSADRSNRAPSHWLWASIGEDPALSEVHLIFPEVTLNVKSLLCLLARDLNANSGSPVDAVIIQAFLHRRRRAPTGEGSGRGAAPGFQIPFGYDFVSPVLDSPPARGRPPCRVPVLLF